MVIEYAEAIEYMGRVNVQAMQEIMVSRNGKGIERTVERSSKVGVVVNVLGNRA